MEGANSTGIEETVAAGAEDLKEEPSSNRPQKPSNKTKEGDKTSIDRAIDSITGAVTGTPLFGPYMLCGILILFIALRLLKKI